MGPPATAKGTARSELDQTCSAFVTLAAVCLVIAAMMTDHNLVRWNNLTVGVLILAFGAMRVIHPHRRRMSGAVTLGLGYWLIAAPFALGFADVPTAAWGDIVLGSLIVISAGTSVVMKT